MKVVVITAQKGGSGKTTLSRNLSVVAAQDGMRVLCIDLDPQQSLRQWWQSRTTEQPAMLNNDPTPSSMHATMQALEGKFDLVVIDTPPAAPEWMKHVLSEADLAIVPVRPSPDDLRAVGATISALNYAKLPFVFVLSQTPRARLTEEAARALAQHGRVSPTNIAQRVSFAETGASGQGVTETADSRAAAEITETWKYLKGLLA